MNKALFFSSVFAVILAFFIRIIDVSGESIMTFSQSGAYTHNSITLEDLANEMHHRFTEQNA